MGDCAEIVTRSSGSASCYGKTVKNGASSQRRAAPSVPPAIAAITIALSKSKGEFS
jgi:hypothetical protein